uniref:Uncharacterized protein n=1 Tax=Anguilla anguilla TaxID=7936 RepID=A0A0E9TXF7_ANGAN
MIQPGNFRRRNKMRLKNLKEKIAIDKNIKCNDQGN